MTSRPRSRRLTSKLLLLAREAARHGRFRALAGLTAAAAVIGSASLGFALNQDQPAAVGLQEVWPDSPPDVLSEDSFSRLDGNWATWSGEAAADVAELYALADKDLDAQRQALAKVQSRVRVLERALRDPAYSMIRNELTSLYVPLKLRAELFEKALDVLTGDATAAAEPARAAAATEVRNALSSLEADLKSVSNGEAWLPYLKADEVRGSLDTPGARATLEGLSAKLDPNAEGRTPEQQRFLSRPSLRRYASAVADYAAVLRVAEQGADQPALREGLASLVTAIDEYEGSPTAETAQAILQARQAIQSAAGPLAAPLDDLVRRNFLNYNLRLVADSSFVSKLVSTEDIDAGPVRDFFMGARIYGNQTTQSHADLQFIPSEEEAQFTLNLSGVTNSRTNAYTSQATVSSVGTHRFYASKPIVFDGDRFTLGPTDLSVNPSIRHVGIRTKYDNIFFGLFKGMIRRRGMAEANSRLPAGRAHAADELRENFLPRFDSEVDQQFGQQNADLAAFDDRARRKGVAPRAERVRTTSDRLLLDEAVRNDDELGGGPPNIGSTRGVGFTLQLHQSLLNNTADRWGFAGRTMTDDEVEAEIRAWLEDLLGRKLKPKTQPDDREPTTLIFAEQDPIRFRIENGAVVLVLRVGIREEDGEEIPPHLVEVPLNLSVSGDKIVIDRGPLRVSARGGNIVRAGVIRRRLEQTIKGGTRDAVFNVEREGRSPMPVRIQRADAQGGWLTLYGV